MPKTGQNGIFCSFTGKIYFENLLMLEKTVLKTFHQNKIFFFHLLSVEFKGGGDNNLEG